MRGLTGQLTGPHYDALFGNVIADPVGAVAAQFVFMLITAWVVARGVQSGIESANKYMMPALFILGTVACKNILRAYG